MKAFMNFSNQIGTLIADILGENEVVIQASDIIFILLIIMVITSVPVLRNRILNPYQYKPTKEQEKEDECDGRD